MIFKLRLPKSILTALIFNSGSLFLEATPVPLTARSPFVVKNFHDVAEVVEVMRDGLDLTGGRLKDGEACVLFAPFRGEGCLVRLDINEIGGSMIRVQGVMFPASNGEVSGIKNGEFSKKEAVISGDSLAGLMKITNFLASNTWYDDVEMESGVAPNLQIYILTTKAFGLIEHVPKNSLIDDSVKAIALLMKGLADNGRNPELNRHLSEQVAKAITWQNENDVAALKGMPYREMKSANETSIVGLSEEDMLKMIANGVSP